MIAAVFISLAVTPMTLAQENRTDEEIGVALAERLSWDPRLSVEGLEIKVADGVVTLNGTVETLMQKRHAAEVASSRIGVRSIVNTLVVRGGTQSDSLLKKAAKQALKSNPVTEKQKITVNVENGFITLGGAVERYEFRQVAEELVAEISGVRGIYNKINVEYKNASLTDKEMTAHIQRRFASDVWLDDTRLEIRVREGVAELAGHVGTLSQLRHTTQQAWVPGVVAVDVTQVEIAPYSMDAERREPALAQRTNAEVASAIEDALKLHPWVPAEAIKVSVKDGVATLEGVVEYYGTKTAARQTAGSTVGVNRVDDLITVMPAREVRDEDLSTAVQVALQENHHSKPYPLKVTVDQGKVTMEGQVETPFERRQAGVTAAAVYGIRGIDNRIEVNRFLRGGTEADKTENAPEETAYDERLKKRIEKELFWNWGVDSSSIKVHVHQGAVTLQGSVANARTMKIAVKAAIASGALSVVNELRIEP